MTPTGFNAMGCPIPTDKHETGLAAVKMAHKMDRQTTRAALAAEGEELARLRAEGEERLFEREWKQRQRRAK